MARRTHEGWLWVSCPAEIRPYLEKLNGGAASERELEDFVAWLAYSAASYMLVCGTDEDPQGAAVLARAARRLANRWQDTAPENDEE